MSELRRACDRCHGMKLRCPKLPGVATCSRCSKANAACIFSPPSRVGRQNGNGLASSSEVDWSQLFAFDQSASLQREGFGFGGIDPMSNLPLDPAVEEETTPQHDHQNETEELADIMVKLDQAYKRTPGAEIHHVSASEVQQHVEALARIIHLKAVLELLLGQTQRLVEIYPRVVSAATRTSKAQAMEQECQIPDCLHLQKAMSSPLKRTSKVDYVLLSLVLACHGRTLDIAETLLGQGRACIRFTAHLPDDHDRKFDVPEIRIGSFVAPASAAASVFISMLVDSHVSLLRECNRLATAASSLDQTGCRDVKILQLQCEMIKERTDALLSEIDELRDKLTSWGLMRS